MKHDLAGIASRFELGGAFIEAEPYGSGHINDTYSARVKTPAGEKRYILQRINTNVFREPEHLMENIGRVTNHLRAKLLAAGGDPDRETLTLLPADDGKNHAVIDENYWRAYRFIEGARTYDLVENLSHVYHAAHAFGTFQKHLSDLPGGRLHETIPHFHNTRKRFDAFQEALQRDVKNRAAACKAEIDFALQREADASVLVDLLAAGKTPERITHNDTKFNNVMIDDATGRGVCVIDLDTVMPGLPMYDFGDSVRTGAATAKEDETDLSKCGIGLDMFERLAHGYLDAAREFLLPVEIGHMAFSAKLITFTIGLRFLTDHLAGDTYFKIHRENHNLDRCRTQWAMVADMETKADQMEAIIAKYAQPQKPV
ncbi:MAG: aminoglycoside phosphotransferase family protein [Phycisphaerae bacterium]|nr:aminoglycoside phosphotransferase family protein [Phycisphaerae bacterium]